MKKTALILTALVLCFSACKKDDVPEGYTEHQDVFYKNPVPVQYDSNGDGVIDDFDASIEVLGGNLIVSENPNGGALFSGENNDAQVSNGVRYCYQNADKFCDKNGALYSIETALNASWETLLQNNTATIDENKNGVWDYIDEISQKSYIYNIAKIAATAAANDFVTLFNQNIAPEEVVPSVEGIIFNAIHNTIVSELETSLQDSREYIDVTKIHDNTKQKTFSVITYTSTAPENDWVTQYGLSFSQLDVISISAANNAATIVSTKIAEDALVRIKQENAASNNKLQGLCPNGYHVPSDADWILFELALGMSAADAMQSGIEVINRGADAKVVDKMINTHGFTYGGYITELGNFTQKDDAAVFVSSTVGSDENGNYMWVRQIDKDYSGVVRYKHYVPSGLSVRCFKN